MKLIIRYHLIILLSLGASFLGRSQTCLTINAGTNTTTCQGSCANLNAVISQSVRATTVYSVSSVANAPLPYTGGTNAFAFGTDDIWSQPINIGFNFCYFGTNFNQCLVGSNGQLTFSTALAGSGNNFNVTTALPNLVDLPGNTICGGFRDIDPSQGGFIRTYTTGVAPCRRFVAYWLAVPHFGNGCSAIPSTTFQIVLNETTNDVQIFIDNQTACTVNSAGAAIVGIQNANGTVGNAAPGRNFPGAWTAINEGWLFRPNGASATSITWNGPSGIVGTGLTATVCPTVNTTYTAAMVVTQCNGATNTVTSTVQVAVSPTPNIVASSNTTNICPNTSVSLNATGALTYTWNPGNLVGSSPVVTPGSTTTYTVIGTGVGSCTSSALVTVTVIPSPTLIISNLSPSICAGGSSTLSATGGVSYTWQPIGVNASSVVVNPLTSTTYTLLGSNASGCTSSVTTNVAVFALPLVSISAVPNPLCAGSTATLTASGATNYTWSTGATIPSIVVNPTVTTTFSVIGSAVSGCTASAITTVTVIPLFPVVINPSSSTVCPNTSVNLFASAAAISYTWLPVNVFTPTVSVSPSVTTVYTVIASNGICSNTATATVVTLAAPVLNPVASPTAVCVGNSSTLSASGALTYTWLPGGVNTPSFTATPPVTTVFSVSGTNGLGCVSTQTLALTVNPIPTISTLGTSTAICAGSNGTLNATGATSYTWSPGNITFSTAIVSPTVTTTYTVVGATSGCTNTQTATMLVNPTPTVIASTSSNSICIGQTATLSATGAISFTWNPGNLIGSSVNVSPVTSTIYTVTGVNGSNCTSTRTIAITVNPLPTLVASATPTAICNAGTVTLTATGANTYTWNPGNLNGSVVTPTLNTTTVYTVTGSSLSGCTNSAIVTVSVNTLSPIAIVATPTAICSGASATLSASGPSSFTWTPGNLTTAAIVVNPTVSTTYTATSTSGACTSAQTLNLVVNPLPVLTATSNPIFICSGNTATLTATGASTYTWNPGNLTGSSVVVSPAASSIFTVTGTSALGCTSTRTLILNVIPTPTLTVNASPSSVCLGNTTTLTASGAATYVWNPISVFSATAFATPLANTVYTVNGSNGVCVSTRTILVTVNPLPIITPAATPSAICSGNSATLSATGGVTYTWTPGNFNGSSVVVSPTISTVFTVTSTNSLGCNGTATVALNVNPNPTIFIAASPSNICLGGSATLTASGAANYTWSPIPALGPVVVLNPTVTTNYTVLGSTGACSSTQTVTVVVNPLPILTVSTSSAAICAGSPATLTASGASTYTWNPGNLIGASVVVTPTSSTVYTVNATSALGCNATRTIALFVAPTPIINPIATPALICSGSSATLSATGAASYTWNPGNLTGSSVTVSPLVSTTYTVNGTNLFGCVGTRTVALNVTPTPTVLASASAISICSGASTTLTATGANNYTWTPGNITSSVAVVSPTVTTTFTVTGNAGICSDVDTITIFVNPTPILNLSASSTTICSGDVSTLIASGATSYTWNPGNLNGTTIVVSPTVTTTYSVTGSNFSGCNSNGTITIVVNPLPVIIAFPSPAAICSGNSATLIASGGTTYTWTPGNLNGAIVSVTPVATTIFTVTSNNALGCTGTATVSVLVSPTPIINVSTSQNPICIGNSATLTATGATSFTWNPGAITTPTAVVTPTTFTTYTVTGTIGSCTSTTFVPVFVLPLPNITATAAPDTICSGALTTLSANGALTYTWLPGSLNGAVVNTIPAASTQFTVSGTDASGCVGTQTVDVVVNPLPVVTIAATPGNSICAGNSVTLSASGANSYTWVPSNVNTSSIVETPLSTQTFTVFGETSGCAVSSIITITVVPSPTLTITPSASTVCAGNSVILTATGATSFTWNPGAITTPTAVVTPTAFTTYTVTGDVGGCTSTTLVPVSVSPLPNITATAVPDTICSGALTTLSANGALTYTWLPGSLNGSVVNTILTASTQFTVSGTDASGCVGTQIVDVVVNPLPVVTIAAIPGNSICAGNSVTLSASGANSYTWVPSNVNTSSIVETPLSTQTFTVFGETSGCAVSSILTITVVPLPTLTITPSASTVCAGNQVTLTATGANTYTWLPASVNGSVFIDAPLVSTTYTLFGESNGCSNNSSATIVVDTNPTVTASASSNTICSGGSVTLSAIGANTYTWNPGNLTGTSITVNPTTTTTYSLQGQNGNGCLSNINLLTVTVTPAPSIGIAASALGICAGSTVSLTALGATNYTWLPSNANGTIEIVSPTTTTSYTLLGDNGGCVGQSAVTVTVSPAVTIAASNSAGAGLCASSTVTLSANGATSYTWSPGNLSGSSVTVTPTVTTTYTVVGDNGAGCTGTAVTTVSVLTAPSLTISSPAFTICANGSTTLNASGANTYTWVPFGITPPSISVSPTVTTTYTLLGSDGVCTASTTVIVFVDASPSLTVAASPTLICGAGSSTLNVSGALSYTWQPVNVIGSSVVVTPTSTTIYTVTGANANGCLDSTTLLITVGTAPSVTALNNGPINCTLTSVTLSANVIASNVAFIWNGPGTYTSALQNPSGISVPGDYTVTAIDVLSGCSTTAVTTVTTDPSVPQLTVTPSGSLSCVNTTVSILAVTNATNASYSWTGPSSFTASAATITVSAGGVYSLTVVNLDSNCPASTVVTVSGNTVLAVTATIIPATCSGTITNNDGSIFLGGYGISDRFDLVPGPSYTGTAVYATASVIAASGLITSTLVNPIAPVPYTVRVFDVNGCTIDITLTLTPTSCQTVSPNSDFGLAKAVSTASLQTIDGSYNVTYTVVAQNASLGVLSNVTLVEALANTFPAPTTFSIISAPVVTNTNSGLVINPLFDGVTQAALTLPTSIMAPRASDTIVFQVNIIPNGAFGPFNNSILGTVISGTNVLSDISQTGLIPDPNSDLNFADNNQPTVLLLDPFRFFGITKEGSVSKKLSDNTYDVTYTITVHNRGNDTLRNVLVKDSLFNNTVKLPASYVLRNGPITSGMLIANPAYNGNSDINLIVPASSKIAPLTTERIIFTINIVTDTVTIYRNRAIGNALGSGNVAVSDTSNNGNNPDTNNNGIWNEAVDNVPTVLIIKTDAFFIPDVFTPDGDGKNDFFVIKGLNGNVDNALMVFNRWGSKVYEKTSYDNTWDGIPNVSGTFGSQKLPPGTYYYIFETKDGSKPITGFIVIQY